jgi:hypothetical protein
MRSLSREVRPFVILSALGALRDLLLHYWQKAIAKLRVRS